MINTKKHEYICDKCKCQVNKAKELKKLNSGHYCKKCYQIKRLEKRKQLHIKLKEEGVIRHRRTPEEIKFDNINKQTKPKINGKKLHTPKCPSLGLYITKNEKQVLFKKYKKLGMTNEEADYKIKNICKSMEALVKRLREKKIEDKEINKIFKERFAKLIEQ